jgi:protein TonB
VLHAIGLGLAAFCAPSTSFARVAWSGADTAAIELSIAQPRGLEPVAAVPPIPLVAAPELVETADAALAEVLYELPPPPLPQLAGLSTQRPPEPEPETLRPRALSVHPPPRAEAPNEAALASSVDSMPRDGASVQASAIPGRNVPPSYPFVALRRHIEGTVVVEIDIDADGRVTATRLAASSGCKMLDDAAVQQLATWEFTPARGALGPVSCTMRQEVVFRIRA